MKRRILILFLVFCLVVVLASCKKKCGKNKDEKPITVEGESTLVATNKNVSDLKDDSKNVLYAYLNNYYNNLKSIKIDTVGTLKAKILVINYNINFGSTTIRKQDAAFRTAYSHSALMNYDSILYETKTHTVESTDLKTYKVYTREDYEKVDFSTFTPLLMGIICNDDTINSASLVSEENGLYTFKYIFDVDKATTPLKISTKHSGDLSEYPAYSKVEIELSMKNDYTPVKLVADLIYSASKPIIGSTVVEQHSELTYSCVNEDLVIEDEAKYIELTGRTPDKIEEKEDDPALNDFLSIFKGLDLKEGISVNGSLTSDILKSLDQVLTVSTDLEFKLDIDKAKEENIYQFGNIYFYAETDETLSSILQLVSSFAQDALGDYSDLLNNLTYLRAYYLGDGKIYLECRDADKQIYYMNIVKLTDILDKLLTKLNVNNIQSVIQGDLSNQYLTLEKEEVDENSYKLKVVLSSEYVDKIKGAIEGLFEKQPMVKSILNYKEFGEIIVEFKVENDVISSIYAKITYLSDADEIINFAVLELNFDDLNHEFAGDAKVIGNYDDYLAGKALDSKIKDTINDFHFDYLYKDKALAVLAEYDEAKEEVKAYAEKDAESLGKKIENLDQDIEDLNEAIALLSHIDTCKNEDILKIYTLYKGLKGGEIVDKTIGTTLMQVYNNLDSYVDYLDAALVLPSLDVNKEVSEWGLTAEQITSYQVLFKIANENSSVSTNLMMFFITTNIMNYFTVSEKILNYNA